MGSPSFKSAQKQEEPVPTTKTDSPETQQAAAEALRRRKMASGYRGTILASLAGASGQQTMGA